MKTADLAREINMLPIPQLFFVVEETIKSIKGDGLKSELDIAVAALYDDYKTDVELTAFTDLDFENFYETK